MLITVGGGSATGLAKAVVLETGLPIVAVPTTYAGSEMTAIWGHTDSAGKTTGWDGRVLPRAVIYDPTLTLSLPPEITGASGMNALAHALYGAWLAGWCLGSTTMGLHHKLAHVLGGIYRLPHAGVHSALLPHAAAYNASAARSGFTCAARALGVGGPDLTGRPGTRPPHIRGRGCGRDR